MTCHALKQEMVVHVRKESSFGAMLKPRSQDAIKVLNFDIKAQKPPTTRDDNDSSSGTTKEMIESRIDVSLSLESYVLPSGSVGVAPDLDPVLENIFGSGGIKFSKQTMVITDYLQLVAETVTVTVGKNATVLTDGVDFDAATSDEATAASLQAAIDAISGVTATVLSDTVTVTVDTDYPFVDIVTTGTVYGTITGDTATQRYVYVLTSGCSHSDSLCAVKNESEILQKTLDGIYIDNMTLNMSGTDQPKITCDGKGAQPGLAGRTTVNGNQSTVSTIVVTSVEPFTVGCVLSIDDEDDLLVTAIDSTAKTLTIDSTISVSDGDVVKPFVQEETTIGSPIAGIAGTIRIGETAYCALSATLTVANGVLAINDCIGTDTMSGYAMASKRQVTGSIVMRSDADNTGFDALHMKEIHKIVKLQCGSVSGKIMALYLEKCRFTDVSNDDQDGGPTQKTMAYQALGENADSEVFLTFE